MTNVNQRERGQDGLLSHSARIMTADYLSSWFSFGISLSIAHPVDTLRVRWQTLGQAPLVTLRVDGVRSLFAGIISPFFTLIPLVALMFAVCESTREYFRSIRCPKSQERYWLTTELGSGFTPFEDVMGGAVAGIVTSLPNNPLAVVRVAQQNSARQGRATVSVRELSTQLYAVEGWRGFFRALRWEVASNALGRAVYFLAYDLSKDWLTSIVQRATGQTDVKALPYSQQLCFVSLPAAILTSLAWWTSVFPLDYVKTKLQADLVGKTIYGGSFSEVCRQTYRTGGLRAFWNGYLLTIVRSIFRSGIGLPLYDLTKPVVREWLHC